MPRPDPSRRAAFEVLKAVRVKDAYTNLVLPHVLGSTDSPVGTPHSRPSWRRARSGARAPTTPCSPLYRPPAREHAGQGPRHPPPRLPPAAEHARRATRGDQHQRRPRALRGRPGACRLRQRRPPTSVRPRSRGLADPAGGRPVGPFLPPGLGRRRVGRGRRWGRARLAARGRQRPARRHARGTARALDRRRASGRTDHLLAVRRGVAGRQPGRRARGRRRPGRCAGRGLAAGRPRARRRPDRRRRRALARPVRGTRGARPLCSRPSLPPAAPGSSPTSACPIEPSSYVAHGGCRGRRVGDRRGRHLAALARGLVRPGARRRAVHGVGCPPAPAGGALATPARGSPRARPPPASPGRPRARSGPTRWGSCSTRRARRCSPRPATSSARSWSGVTTPSSVTPRPS